MKIKIEKTTIDKCVEELEEAGEHSMGFLLGKIEGDTVFVEDVYVPYDKLSARIWGLDGVFRSDRIDDYFFEETDKAIVGYVRYHGIDSVEATGNDNMQMRKMDLKLNPGVFLIVNRDRQFYVIGRECKYVSRPTTVLTTYKGSQSDHPKIIEGYSPK